jgi:UDP-glucose 4-epimerase
MAEGSKRILITGVSRFLGLRLAKALEKDDSVDLLVGVDLEEPPVAVEGLEFIRADIRNPLIARVLESTRVDTLVHTNISSTPGLLGGRSSMKEINVIGTMQLLAAAQRAQALKKVVMKSSCAVYGAHPGGPSVIPEEYSADVHHLTGYGQDCAEAETYARDFGRRRPDVDLVILRTQNVVGPTVQTSIMDYLSLPVIPTALGFDPRLQLLHEEDAVEALRRAVVTEHHGIFNVSGDGAVYLSKAIRMLGGMELPLLLPLARGMAAFLRRAGLVDFPMDQLRLLLFGRVVSRERARRVLGFEPRHSTEDGLLDVRARRGRGPDRTRPELAAWEKELLEHAEPEFLQPQETLDG